VWASLPDLNNDDDDVSELQYTSIIFSGDMNIDITDTNGLSNVLANFVYDLGLKFVDTVTQRLNNIAVVGVTLTACSYYDTSLPTTLVWSVS